MSQPPLAHRLNSLITSDQAVSDLRCYFGTGLLDEAVPFTGSRFEHLAGGGDRQAVANVVTADDLIAVQTLSVRIPAKVAVELLEGHLGVRLSELLSSVRFDIDMVEAEAADLAEASPAHTAWRVLCDQPGIGWVTALDASPYGSSTEKLHRDLKSVGRTGGSPLPGAHGPVPR